jgi:hypothetical protein
MLAEPASYVLGLWRERTAQSHDARLGGSGRGGVVRAEAVTSHPSGGLVDRLAAPQTIDLSEQDKSRVP